MRSKRTNRKTGARVFVTDGRSIASLAVARSLGMRGLAVTCGESFKHNPTFYSRYTDKTVLYADPRKEPDRFVQDLEEELARGAYATIVPVRDDATLLLAQHRERFEQHVGFCVSDYETLLIGRDKARTAKAAIKHGVPIPKTYLPEHQALETIASQVPYPALIKPRVSSGARGIAFVLDAQDLLQMYPVVKAAYGESIIQEYISEDRRHLSACFLLNSESQLRAAFVYEELRQYPIRGGPATFAVSVDRPDVIEYGAAFLQRLGWRGVAHFDFVVDPKDGQAKMLEMNPRFWMSLPLAVHAGVDFPYLLHRLVVDGDVEPIKSYRIGSTYRWFLPQDVLWFLHIKKTWGHVREFLRFRNSDQCYAICSNSDPRPILGTCLQAFDFLRKKSTRDFILKRGW